MQKRTAVFLAPLVVGGLLVLAGWGGGVSAASTQTRGVVRFDEADTSLAGNLGTIVFTGAITDYGRDHQGVPQDGINRIVLPNGSFSINVNELGNKLASLPVNPATCSFSGSARGRIPIVEGSGMHSYKGIGGAFGAVGTEAGVWPRDARGRCDTSGQPKGVLLVTGSGTVSYK